MFCPGEIVWIIAEARLAVVKYVWPDSGMHDVDYFFPGWTAAYSGQHWPRQIQRAQMTFGGPVGPATPPR